MTTNASRLITATESQSLKMGTTSSALEGMTQWTDIPKELQDMMLCHVCNLQAYELEPCVVLPCAHVMCVECMQKRLDQTAARDTVPCPLCGAFWKLPYGDILGFPTDVFSRVVNNSLLGRSHGMVQPNPKCALHPREDVAMFCKSCSVTICELCCERYHKGHMKRVEPIESQRQKINYEFTELEDNLARKKNQIDNVIKDLTGEKLKMVADINQISERIRTETQLKTEQLTQKREKLQKKAKRDIDELTMKQEQTRKEAEEEIKDLRHQQEKMEQGLQQNIAEVNLKIDKLQRGLEDFYVKEAQLETQFSCALEQLEEHKRLVEHDQLFVETLNKMGNESDKLARLPGMKNMIANEKHLSGRTLKLESLKWKSDVCVNKEAELSSLVSKLKIAESVVESLGDIGESLFPGLRDVCTVAVPCKPAWLPRSAGLFGQQHILHTFRDGDNADKLCLHNIPQASTHLIPVPGMRLCAAPVVVDGAAGEIVAADWVREWTDGMFDGESEIHLSGSLHWLTLSNNYSIIKHEVIPLQCVQNGFMSLDHVGHLLVLTHCTAGQHPKQLVVYDNNRCVLHTISLPDLFVIPLSAVSYGLDTFVVLDWGKDQVIWIDQHGQVLQQYGLKPGEELKNPQHIIQHSKGSLLIADWSNNQVHLVSKEAKLLQCLLKEPVVQYPLTLHLDEQAGLLCVAQWEDSNNVKVRTFQFLPCTTHIKQVCLSVQL